MQHRSVTDGQTDRQTSTSTYITLLYYGVGKKDSLIISSRLRAQRLLFLQMSGSSRNSKGDVIPCEGVWQFSTLYLCILALRQNCLEI